MIKFIDTSFYQLKKKKYYKKNECVVKSKYISRDIILGKRIRIGKNVIVEKGCKINDYTYINSRQGMHPVYINANTTIGKYCSIGANSLIGIGNHPLDRFTTHPITYDKYYSKYCDKKLINKVNMDGNVVIGNDVWIGCNVIIMQNIKIGDGAVIGAGSIVTKNVEPYSIYVGSPAKKIGMRFNIDTINKINNSNKKWWDEDFEEIMNKIQIDNSINIFLE